MKKDISDMLEAWIKFIEDSESKVIESLEMTREEIKEAKEELIRISINPKEREIYEKRKESILNRVSALENAEKKGEYKAKLDIAINLLDVLDDKTISSKTGLSIDTVSKLRN